MNIKMNMNKNYFRNVDDMTQKAIIGLVDRIQSDEDMTTVTGDISLTENELKNLLAYVMIEQNFKSYDEIMGSRLHPTELKQDNEVNLEN